SPKEAEQEFWRGFQGGDYNAVEASRELLLAAIDVDPKDDVVPRVVGMSYAFSGLEGPTRTSIDQVRSATDLQGKYLKIALDRATAPNTEADAGAVALDM